MKCIIISQPKAGTYLCANLLIEFGLDQTGLHLSENEYQKYNLDNLDLCRGDPKKYTKKKRLEKSIELINENEFAVGHLNHSDNIELLKPFKKIILLRNEPSIKESAKRWKVISKRNVSEGPIILLAREVKKWQQEDDVFVMEFKSMIKKDVDVIDKLQEYLFGEVKHDSLSCITRALKKPSLTKSNVRI